MTDITPHDERVPNVAPSSVPSETIELEIAALDATLPRRPNATDEPPPIEVRGTS